MKKLKPYLKKMPIKTKSYLFIHNIYKSIGLWVGRLFLLTPLSANHITIIDILIGCLAGVFFALGRFVIGSIMFIFFALLDRVDGLIARYKNNVTEIGNQLALLSHPLVEIFTDVGLVFGVYALFKTLPVLLAGVCMITFGLMTKSIPKPMKKMISKKKFIDELNIIIFLYLYTPFWVIVFYFFNMLEWFIYFQALARGLKLMYIGRKLL